MRPVDADSIKKGIAEFKQSPWYNEKCLDHYPVRKEAVEVIEHLCIDKEPTIDAVPVVRCKDCKHWHGKSENDATEECDGVMGIIRTTPDFFCAYGEEKDDA